MIIRYLLLLFFIIVSFGIKAQENRNDIKILQEKTLEFEKSGDTLKDDYHITINKLAFAYQKNNELSLAETLFKKNVEYTKKYYHIYPYWHSQSCLNLALVFHLQKKFYQAESNYRKAIEIEELYSNPDIKNHLLMLNNLAQLYRTQKRYTESEITFLKVLELFKKNDKVYSLEYANGLNQIALLFEEQNKFIETEEYLLKRIEILEEILEEKDLKYIDSLSYLAEFYFLNGKYNDALPLFLKVLSIREKYLGKKHIDYALSLNNLGSLYAVLNRYAEAEPLLLCALEIRSKTFGKNSRPYLRTIDNLSVLYAKQGKTLKANKMFLESLEIKTNIAIDNYKLNSDYYRITDDNGYKMIISDYNLDFNKAATGYRQFNSIEDQSLFFEAQLRAINKIIIANVKTMNEEEILNYININKTYFFMYLSFLYDVPTKYPEININGYDNNLLLSNLSLRSQNLVKKSILKSPNLSLQNKYKKFKNNLKAIQNTSVKSSKPLSSKEENLKIETEKLEKILISESTSYLKYKKNISTNLNDIKTKLKPNTIVVDLVDFNYFGNKVTDSVIYAAFVVKNDFETPKFIPLFEQKQLMQLISKTTEEVIRNQINKQYTIQSISDLFLKPLVKELRGIDTIYFTPSGLGHQIDFSALPISDNKTFGEKYNLHILSSPAELVSYKVSKLNKKSNIELILYGGIDYNKSEEVETTKPISYNTIADTNLITRSGIKNFGYLQGTNKEIEEIALSAKQYGFKTTSFTERIASETSIKKLDGRTQPFVLHLATHGFFFPDPEKDISQDMFGLEGKRKIYKRANDPMMRSGLLFAGANKFWGKPNDNQNKEDGILTASEISNLDLSACELVVLSACETGLGKVQGSEGVFGLQRAFKMAGVKNIIMSLWKVPDAQTAELFDIFYEECFKGKSIHKAFQTAQSTMKEKYSPYFWAGFVLLE